jgi:NAD(P)-dependent dehydrogenase (short-subunit alcohol dehydrogenase family)
MALVAGFANHRGGLDAAVAAAGTSSRHTIPQMDAATWRRVIDVNLTGAFLTIKAAAAHAAPGGASIAVISSIAAAHIAYLSGVHYAASKAALTGLVRHAAFELGRRDIRVNAVAPGPMTNRMGGRPFPEDRQAAAAQNLPLQRLVTPSDVAEVCWFLASPAARAVTGVYLPVDSGFLTGRGVPYRPYFDLHEEAF